VKKEKHYLNEFVIFSELVKNPLSVNDNWIVLYSLRRPCKTAATLTFTSFLKVSCRSQFIMINYHLEDAIDEFVKKPQICCVSISFSFLSHFIYECVFNMNYILFERGENFLSIDNKIFFLTLSYRRDITIDIFW
jgi:hypothetical protein